MSLADFILKELLDAVLQYVLYMYRRSSILCRYMFVDNLPKWTPPFKGSSSAFGACLEYGFGSSASNLQFVHT